MFSALKKICCIESSTFFYFLKLQTKILHPRLQQGHSEIISNPIYMPFNSKYFPNNTWGPEPVPQKRWDPKSRRGSWALPGLRGEVGRAALSPRQDAQLWNKPGEQPLSGREYAGEWRERERMCKRSVCLFVYLADSTLLALAAGPPDTEQRPIPGVISASSLRVQAAFQFSSCIPGSA